VLGASITFTAQVLPSAAPQGVNWRVIWNSQDWGSGNATVGTINAGGTYTAPTTLPSPDQVRIDAVSQAASAVFGSYFIDLVAPPPTSFNVTPTTVSLFAGGAGQQFNAVNFLPSNANTSVSWEINPVVGGISQAGFYTPPATVGAQQNITVTARSVVAPTVFATATVNLQPPAQVAPTGVVITPDGGLTISASGGAQTIQFTAQVNPGGASQAVTWSMLAPAFGNISSSGLYTPAVTGIDRLVTIRATAQVSPFPFADVQVRVCGDGINWNEIANLTLGRGQASATWDPLNSRMWVMGGTTETSVGVHDDTPLFLNLGGSTPALGAYSSISAGTGTFAKPPNCLMCVCDTVNDRLIAIVGQGANDIVKLYELDLSSISSTPAWTAISAGNTSSAPKLDLNERYHTWYDSTNEEICIMKDKTEVYRFETDQDDWDSVKTTSAQTVGPTDVQLVGHTWNQSGEKSYFVGALDSTASATNRVWELRRTDYQWRTINSTGAFPSIGVRNPAIYYHNSKIWMFGGREANKIGHSNDLYELAFSGPNMNWTKHTATTERPQPRSDACFLLTGFGNVYLYGGEIPGIGCFGDLWYFDESTLNFFPENADNMRPQGRKHAAGAWGPGEGIVYGGICDHGVDSGTWTFSYSGTAPTWTRRWVSGTVPPPLWGASSIWDSLNGVFIMYGGDSALAGFSGLSDKYWAFDPFSDTWTQLGTGPGKRREAAMYYDDVNHRVWMFGGIDDNGNKKNDLWYLNLSSGLPGNWVATTTTGGSPPDPRTGATIGYDSRSNRVLVCGGNSTISGANSQLYAYGVSSGIWSPLSVGNTGSQENVEQAAAIYDDEYQRIISTPGARKKTQGIVLATGGATWHYMTPPPAANNSTGATGLYDPSTGRYYALFGERTILSRNIGSNNLRTFVVK
jgi:hypothetical protein